MNDASLQPLHGTFSLHVHGCDLLEESKLFCIFSLRYSAAPLTLGVASRQGSIVAEQVPVLGGGRQSRER